MLGELHAALRDYPGELPLLAPPLSDIPRGLERLERAGDILPADDIALLRARYEQLLPRLSPSALGPVQPIHGDAHVHNLIAIPDGWLWNDFEDACLGPVAWDLASLDHDGEALTSYPDAPDPASITLFRDVRLLHGIVWVYALLPEFPDWGEHVAPMLERLRDE
jgi:Ser/Thr protein kinase RdoA (MazF antagonist)